MQLLFVFVDGHAYPAVTDNPTQAFSSLSRGLGVVPLNLVGMTGKCSLTNRILWSTGGWWVLGGLDGETLVETEVVPSFWSRSLSPKAPTASLHNEIEVGLCLIGS